MKLKRRAQRGERLTATQVVRVESPQSTPYVEVKALPVAAIQTTRPTVGTALYECGRVVPVGNLVPSTRVHAYENGGEVGVAPLATSSVPVIVVVLQGQQSGRGRRVAVLDQVPVLLVDIAVGGLQPDRHPHDAVPRVEKIRLID